MAAAALDFELEIGAKVDGAMAGLRKIEDKFQALQAKTKNIKIGINSTHIRDVNTIDSKLKSILNTLQAISTVSIPKISFGGVAPKVTVSTTVDKRELGRQITSAAEAAPRASIKVKAEVSPEVTASGRGNRGVKQAAQNISNAFKNETIEVGPTFVVTQKAVADFKAKASAGFGSVEIEVTPVLSASFNGPALIESIKKSTPALVLDYTVEGPNSISVGIDTNLSANVDSAELKAEIEGLIKDIKPSSIKVGLDAVLGDFTADAKQLLSSVRLEKIVTLLASAAGFEGKAEAALDGIDMKAEVRLAPNTAEFIGEAKKAISSLDFGQSVKGPVISASGLAGLREVTEEINKIAALAARDYAINVVLKGGEPKAVVQVTGDFSEYHAGLKKLQKPQPPFDIANMTAAETAAKSLAGQLSVLGDKKQALRGVIGLGITAPGLETKVTQVEKLEKALNAIGEDPVVNITAKFVAEADEYIALRDELKELMSQVQVIRIRFEDIGGGLPSMPTAPGGFPKGGMPGGMGAEIDKDVLRSIEAAASGLTEASDKVAESFKTRLEERLGVRQGETGYLTVDALKKLLQAAGRSGLSGAKRDELISGVKNLSADEIQKTIDRGIQLSLRPLRGGDDSIAENTRLNSSMRKILSAMADTTTSPGRANYMLQGMEPERITTDLAGLASTQRRLYESNPELKEFVTEMKRFDPLLREIAQRFAEQRRSEQPPRILPSVRLALRSNNNELPEDTFNRGRIEAATKKIQFYESKKLNRPALPSSEARTKSTIASVVDKVNDSMKAEGPRLASLLSEEIRSSVYKGFMNTDLGPLGNTLQEFLEKEVRQIAQKSQAKLADTASAPGILGPNGQPLSLASAASKELDRTARERRTLDFIAEDTSKKLRPSVRGVFDQPPRGSIGSGPPGADGVFNFDGIGTSAKADKAASAFKGLTDAVSGFGNAAKNVGNGIKNGAKNLVDFVKDVKRAAQSPLPSASGGSGGSGSGGGGGVPFAAASAASQGGGGVGGGGGGNRGGSGGGGFAPFGGMSSSRSRRFQQFGALDEFNERVAAATTRARATPLYEASRPGGQPFVGGNRQADEIQIIATMQEAFRDLARETLLAAEAQRTYTSAANSNAAQLDQAINRSRVGSDVVSGPIESGFFNRVRDPANPQGNRSFQSRVVERRKREIKVERGREDTRIADLLERGKFNEVEAILDADVGNRRERGPVNELTQGESRQRTSNRPRRRDRGQRSLREGLAGARRQQRGQIISEGLIGGGFPLLFGAGPGSALGGLAGGVGGGLLQSGGGFAGSLIASYLGAQVDIMITNMSTLADSMKSPTQALAALEASGYRVEASLKSQVQELTAVGKAYEAQSLVFAEIERRLGTGAVQELNSLASEQNKLKEQWSELSGSLQRQLIPAMIGVVKVVSDVIAAFNLLGGIEFEGQSVTNNLAGSVANLIPSVGGLRLGFDAFGLFGKSIAKDSKSTSPELTEPERIANARAAFDRQGKEAADVKDAYRQAFQFQREIYDLEQSAVDLRRELIDLERSWADELFNRRKEAAQAEIETARLAAQVRAGQITNSFTAQGIGGDSEEARLLDATAAYLNARGQGEAELQAKQKEAELKIADISKQTADFQFQTAREVEDIERKKLAYVRSVEDYKMKVADYQYEIARKIAELNLQSMAEGGGSSSGGQVGGTANQIAQALMERLNLTKAQAAGVVGNLQRESGLDPRINEGGKVGLPAGKGGYGIAQWTGSRQKDLIRFAGGPEAAGDLQKQIDFLVYELKVKESKALSSLRAAKSPEQAAYVFDRDFERSGIKALPERKANARAVYNSLGGGGGFGPAGGGGNVTFGRTGSMSLAQGYGMVDVRGGNRASVMQDAMDIIRANSSRGVQTLIGGDKSGDVDATRLIGDRLAAAVSRGIDRHASRPPKGGGYAIDLIAKEGTPVGIPLSGVGDMGAGAGRGGNTRRGNLAIHLGGSGGGVSPATGLGRQILDATMPIKPEFNTTPIGATPNPAAINAKYAADGAEITKNLQAQLALNGDIYEIGNEAARLELRKQIVGNSNITTLRQQADILKEQRKFLMENIGISEKGLQDKFAEIDALAQINAILDQRKKVLDQIAANPATTLAQKADVSTAIAGFFNERIANVGAERKVQEEIRAEERTIKDAETLKQAVKAQTDQNRELEATIAAQSTIRGELSEQERIRLNLLANEIDLNSAAAQTLLTLAAKTDQLKVQLLLANSLKELNTAGRAENKGFYGLGAQKYEETIAAGGDEEQARAAAAIGRATDLKRQLGTIQGEINKLQDPAQNIIDLGQSISGAFSTAFQDILSGTVSAQDAFAKMFQSIGASFLQMAAEILAQSVMLDVMRMFLGGSLGGNAASVGGGGGGGSAGNIASIGKSVVGQVVSGLFSFDGGGYTGIGPRVGGLDGKGGFPALLHPNETVIDHTKINSPAERETDSPEMEADARREKLWDSLVSSTGSNETQALVGETPKLSYDGPTLLFDSTRYVEADEVPRIIDRAVKQSYGYQQQKMQNSPAARRAAGMR